MNNISSTVIIKTHPNPIYLLFSFAGILFFGGITAYIYISQSNTFHSGDAISEIILTYLILSVFFFFFLWSLKLIFTYKVIIVTHDILTIKQPLSFIKRSIPLDNISYMEEKEFTINPKIKGTTYEIHNGKQCFIRLKNQKPIQFNSFEILEYEDLMKKLFAANK